MPRRSSTVTVTVTGPAAAAAVVLSLAGCATASAGTAASADSIAAYADAAGIAPELVYTTEVAGYDVAPQSVGPTADDGMSATWFNATTHAMLSIRTEWGEMTAASCAETPVWESPDAPVTCTDEGGLWHRSAGPIHEYVTVRDGVWIQVIGMDGAPQADLLAAAQAARTPSEAELEHLFSDLPDTSTGPVERGDLPENGDGAPIDPTGPGG
ncbi:hypothetical protein N3K63_12135 [Microbacterium sp. W1N]|uniref:hypothetical protein n=1 Tax=Microbacterium festucae TaxID=2977531 RepID=UPI0021BE1020|nr:hypothetical protein [Microbacterium festucae]MCT9821028.1 hypothetical protein [Microbacterium festucae]